MSNIEEGPTPKHKRVPMGAVLRETLWLPKWSGWGFVGIVLFIVVVGGLILMFLVG
jgi:hypothetical protein